MVEPETFPCPTHNAVLTERACQSNQLRAIAEQRAGHITFITKCLTCICPIKKLDRVDTPELPSVHDHLGMPLRAEATTTKPEHPFSKGRRKKRGKIMPKAAAAPEAKNEPFIPEPLADTAKSLGLVAEAPVSEARTEASISQARDLGFKPAPKCKKHPDRDAKINSRGISTGQCEECLHVNTSKGGVAVKMMMDPKFSLITELLKADRHQELLQALRESADANERTLEQEAIYRLKNTVN